MSATRAPGGSWRSASTAVALSDIPAGDAGKVYLVERHVASTAELDGLVADYLALASELQRPPLREDWILS